MNFAHVVYNYIRVRSQDVLDPGIADQIAEHPGPIHSISLDPSTLRSLCHRTPGLCPTLPLCPSSRESCRPDRPDSLATGDLSGHVQGLEMGGGPSSNVDDRTSGVPSGSKQEGVGTSRRTCGPVILDDPGGVGDDYQALIHIHELPSTCLLQPI